jgi:heme A synthase
MPEIISFEKRVGLHSGVFRKAVMNALDLLTPSPAKLLWSAKVRLAEGLRSDFSALSNIFVRLRILHPIVAGALGVWLLALAFQVIASRPSDVIAKRLGRTVGVLVLSQCALGMANIVLLTPPWLQLLHLLGADLLWIACVLLASELLSGPRRTTSPARAEVYAAAYR